MLKLALRNLVSRPMRSLLALLGLSVAIAGMVGLFAVAEGLDEMVNSTFGRVTGLVAMQPAAPMPLFSRIPADWESDLETIRGVETVNAEVWQRVNLIEGEMILSPPRFLFGTDIETRLQLQQGVYRDDMIDGRFLNLEDRGTNNCVISRQIAEEFDKGVGETLSVEQHDLRIVGVYHCGSIMLDVAIVLDIDEVREMTSFGTQLVSAFYIEQTEGEANDELIERIERVFRGRRRDVWQPSSILGTQPPTEGDPVSQFFENIGRVLTAMQPQEEDTDPDADQMTADEGSQSASAVQTDEATSAKDISRIAGGEPAIEVRSSVEWGEKIDDFSADLELFLTIMTSIGVTIAVLSIVNTMLMSVTERIIEFGILKANGWSRRDVVRLITCESAILGVGGGLLGSVLGWIAAQGLNWYYPTRIYLYASPELLGFAVAFATMLGVIGGLYPAFWAMRMVPMDAIRRG